MYIGQRTEPFQCPGNVLAARWADLDLDAGVWTIPAQDMKRAKQAKASGLDHVVPPGAACDRAQYLNQRRTMMQTRADDLDRLREGALVLPFKGAA